MPFSAACKLPQGSRTLSPLPVSTCLLHRQQNLKSNTWLAPEDHRQRLMVVTHFSLRNVTLLSKVIYLIVNQINNRSTPKLAWKPGLYHVLSRSKESASDAHFCNGDVFLRPISVQNRGQTWGSQHLRSLWNFSGQELSDRSRKTLIIHPPKHPVSSKNEFLNPNTLQQK